MKRAWLALAMVSASGVAHAQPTPTDPPPSDPPAPTTSNDRCKVAVQARKLPGATAYCSILAVHVATVLYESSKASTARQVVTGAAQPRITDTPGAQGSTGQTAALASGQPVATTGGSIAAVGDTGQGLELVTALAINPAALAISENSEKSIWATRIADISLVLPVQVDSEANRSQRFRYIGGRFRINTLAAIDPPEKKDAVAAYVAVGTKLEELIPAVASLVERAADPDKCAAAIETRNEDAQLRDCGAVVDTTSVTGAAKTAREALAKFRARADRSYLALEGRFDRGDFTEDSRKDTLLAAYVSAGRVLTSTTEGASFELRGRAGAVFFRDGMTDVSSMAGYLAGGIEVAFVRDLKRYTLSAAFEVTRVRGDNPMPVETATDAIRFGVAVPLADGKVVSVGVSVPTDGGPSTIALSGDWSLLFGH